MPAGETRQIEAVVTDQYGNLLEIMAAVWVVHDDNAGSITPEGLFTAGEVSGSYEDSVAVRLAAGGLTATATITITPSSLEQVIIEPNPAVIGMGMSQQFVAVGVDQYGNRLTDLTISWNREGGGGTLSASGLFTAGGEPGTVIVTATVNKGDEERLTTTNVTVEPDRIAFLSDRDASGDIYVMNADGTSVERVTKGAAVSAFSWSPDGRRLVYSNARGIFVVDDSDAFAFTISEEESDTTPSWSPDGGKILLASSRDDDSEIHVMDPDGGNQTRLTNNAASDRWPTWSPDGEKSAFASDRSAAFLPTGLNRIWVMDADGTDPKLLILNPGQTVSDTVPSWSPDGSEIAFQSAAAGGVLWRVKITSVDGLDTRILASLVDGGGLVPGWTADGERLVYASYRNEDQSDIYITDRNGANTTRLTTDEALDTAPRWVPRKRGVDVNEDSIVIPNASTLRAMTVQEVAANVGDAVVRIETDLGSGSGFVIDSDGQILTNNHVVKDAQDITVSLKDGSEYTASVVGRDMVRDLAVLSIEASGLPTLTLGDIGQTPQGAEVLVVGYPLGTTDLTITKGLVSALKGDTGRNIKWIQTDSAINPGNSGGPLLDLRGRVVGVVSAKLVRQDVEGVGLAISVNTVKLYLEQIIAGADVSPTNTNLIPTPTPTPAAIVRSGPGQLQDPRGIGVGGDGLIYVADTGNHRVQRFSKDGLFIDAWGTNGSGQGQFRDPGGIAFEPSRRWIYVADTGNHRVQVFQTTDAPGGPFTLVATWGTEGSGEGQFRGPSDIAVNSSEGWVYVTDTGNHRVQRFNIFGRFFDAWRTEGSGDGQFNEPSGIAFDASQGLVYVTDTGSHRIQRFNSAGVYFGQWGSEGTGDSKFSHPFGIAVDRTGLVYVADTGSHRVKKFSSSGASFGGWGFRGTADSRFVAPYGIAIDTDQQLVYVADTGNHRVQKFNAAGVFFDAWGATAVE